MSSVLVDIILPTFNDTSAVILSPILQYIESETKLIDVTAILYLILVDCWKFEHKQYF